MLREKRLHKTLLTFIARIIMLMMMMLIIMVIINTQLCSINYSHYGTFPGQSEQNRNKRKEIERFDWFIERI